jgi:hypothetical protein
MNLLPFKPLADLLPYQLPWPARYKNMRSDYRISLLEDDKVSPWHGVLFFSWYNSDPLWGCQPAEMVKRGYKVKYMRRVLPGVDFKEAIEEEYAGGNSYLPELFFHKDDIVDTFEMQQVSLIRRMVEKDVIPSEIWYPAEGQPWEDTLIHAVRVFMPHTMIIGYDNGCIFSGCPLLSQKNLPDRIYTKGPALNKLLLEGGWPHTVVKTGCELRTTMPAKRHTGDGILIALSPLVDEAEDMMEWLDYSYPKTVYVKPHPLLPVKVPKEYRTTLTIPELLERCDTVLYGYTSVCFEALRYEVWPIFIGTPGMDKMAHIPDLYERLKKGEWMSVYNENRAPVTQEILEEMCGNED